MNGHFCSVEETKGTLNISVTNIKKFKELIEKVENQADELQETISQLERFDLRIKFSDGTD